MTQIAKELARWANSVDPSTADVELGDRALQDTLAVILAARDHPLVRRLEPLGAAGRWAVAAHVLDFDDLHIESTSHISAVIVPTVLASGGGCREYLAGAGVMARLGVMLGWSHYTAGWHVTCTAGAPGAAAAAAVARGLDDDATAHAIALAIPAAGGVQRAFGTEAKSLQVGFAADAGVRAAELAANGARGDLGAVEQWAELLNASQHAVDMSGPAIPGGLAVKLFPCCYAMQRPISAAREALAGVPADEVLSIVVSTPGSAVHPLIHSRPTTGLQAKFSLEYAIACAALDPFPGMGSFTDAAVGRPLVQSLLRRVECRNTLEGDGLLAGDFELDVRLTDGTVRRAVMTTPPGAPGRPATDAELRGKFAACGPELPDLLSGISWPRARDLLAGRFGPDGQAPGTGKPQ